jgi:hypothetical protein
VDYHLERGLRLVTKPEASGGWAIQEVDAQGKQIGRDQIPRDLSLYFTATSCVLGDHSEIKSRLRSFVPPEPPESTQGQYIRVQLRPGRSLDFSMFGTRRVIKSFELNIHPITDPAEQERCGAQGSVSFTSEDYKREIIDDYVVFYLWVKPDTFARYAAKIAHGLVDEMIFGVGLVNGFYSDWSPWSLIDSVKVLCEGDEQKITMLASQKVEPPRLGHVGKAELYINRRLEFRERESEPEAAVEMPEFGSERVVPETQAPPAMDPRMLQMLGSLKRAAWLVVCVLALTLIVTLLKR